MITHFEPNRSDYSITRSGGSMKPRHSYAPTRIRRPNYTYKELITMAIKQSSGKALPACGIVNWISSKFMYYRKAENDWPSRVRCTLEENKCFLRMNQPAEGSDFLWTVACSTYKPGDSIALPHGTTGVEIIPFTHSQDRVATLEEQTKLLQLRHPMQEKINRNYEPSRSACNTTNSDGLLLLQGITSSAPIEKPNCTIKELIIMAISNSAEKALPFPDIIEWISNNFLYYQKADYNWQHQVRCTLKGNSCFCAIYRPDGDSEVLWTVAFENYQQGDPFVKPHVGLVGGTMKLSISSADPQAEYSVQTNMIPGDGATNSDGSKSSQWSTVPTPIERPEYKYKELITMAINSSPHKMLPTRDIIDWISNNFPYYGREIQKWQSSVKRALSMHFYRFECTGEKYESMWAVLPTLEELASLQAEEGATMANEPAMEVAQHQQPEGVLYQQQQDEL